jgi:regulator of sigma E protease
MSASAILLFFIILLALVIIHEFGHFIAAKWVGMRVDEFAFGFPPRLFAKKKGETVYAVNALPLGGYVSIWGENGEPDDIARTHPRAFGNRPKWAQLLVLIAGVAMNMALALIIFIGVSYGKVQMSADDPTYGSRVEDAYIMVVDAATESPAQRAGIIPGSVITKMVSGGQVADLHNATSAIAFVERHQNESFAINYVKPNGEIASTTIAAVYGIVEGKKALGISLETVGYVHTSIWEAVKIGTQRTYDITKMTFEGLWALIKSIGGGKSVLDSLSGPIGIAKIVGETSTYGIAAVFTLVAILSVNLAVFNILPLPALDGGRIVVVLIESVIRRKIPHKYYAWVNVVGFLGLMVLLLVVTVHDIWG